MLNEKEISEELKKLPTDEFYEVIKRTLYKKAEKREPHDENIFHLKVLLIRELENKEDSEKRKMLVVKNDNPMGAYKIDVGRLNAAQVEIILKQCLYNREPQEAIIDSSGKIIFTEVSITT